MARMYPAVDPAEIQHPSEEVVYRALRDDLPDDYVVLHSYPWLRPWRDEGALLEGEADFVILHPEKGLLVLEVKGGKTIRHDGHRWVRDTKEGPRQFQDPFEQARRNMHALLDIAKKRSGGRITRNQLSYGYAVVFPHMDYEGDPPNNADRAIVISRRHLPFLKQAIDTAYSRWTTEPRPMRPNQFRMLLNDCLMPRFRVFRPAGPDIDLATQRLLELTETQAQVFEGLYVQDRVLVEGVAGSGKTFLAMQRALAFARCGSRTLFVCYNKELAIWIRARIDEDPTTEEYRELLVVKHFHALAADLAAQAGFKFSPAGGGPTGQAFWDEEVPDLLEQSVLKLETAGESVRYGALVVDEAQDFTLGWWYALTESLLESADAPTYAFMDPNQALRGEVQRPPVEFQASFRLTLNCRNTRKIAQMSAAVLDLEAHIFFSRAPEGSIPRVLRCSTPQQQKGLVLEELKRLLNREDLSPGQIVLIGPSKKSSGSLSSVDEVAGTRLVTSAEQWRAGEGVLVTTSRSFKGLEADVVILYDLNTLGRLFRREDLYVACTRAKALLVAVVHGSEVRQIIQDAIADGAGR